MARAARPARKCIVGRLAALAMALVTQTAAPQVIENPQPIWTAAQRLRLSASPILVIGTQPGSAYEFGHIAGAVRLKDGNIAVGDGASTQLRFYDPRGTYLRAVGRKGDGPGELPGLSFMQWLPGDTIAVGSTEVVSLFSPGGRVVQRIDLYRPGTPLPEGEKEIKAIYPGGSSVVGNIKHWRQTGHAPRTGLRWTDSVHLVGLSPDQRLAAALGDFPARMMEWGKEYDLFSPPQSPQFTSAASAGRFFVGFGSEYAIRVFTAAGRPEMIIHRRWAAGRAPAYDRLLADRVGNLWVREGGTGPLTSGSMTWSVFNAAGRWLGDVAMPARFTPTDIGTDYVLGVSRDADDVERVALFRLTPN